MMRRIISVAAAVFLSLMLLPVFSLRAEASDNYSQGWSGDASASKIIDDYGLFTDDPDTFEMLTEEVQSEAEKLEMNICIFLAGPDYISMTDSGAVIFADDSYDETYGEDTDGVFYYLDLSGKSPACDHISTSGKAVLAYQSSIDSIFSFLDNYLPASGQEIYASDISSAIQAFLRCLEDYRKEPGGLNYYYDDSSGKYFYYKDGQLYVSKKRPPAMELKYGAASVVAGLVVALIIYLIVKRKYRFKSAADSGVYISKEKTRYFQNEDTFIREHTSRTRIESSSGGSRSGGGGGGHSFSGGHGGGSHHR